jgi:hypothetical protein
VETEEEEETTMGVPGAGLKKMPRSHALANARPVVC